MKMKKTDMILKGVGAAAMIAAGVYSFFVLGSAVDTISKIIAVIAFMIGAILLVTRIVEKKGGGILRLDFLIWLCIGFLFANTGILTSLGSIIVIIISVMLILQGINSVRLSLTAGSGNDIFGIVIAVLLILGGGFMLLNSRYVFTEFIGKALGIYLVIQGAGMVKELMGDVKYSQNFKGVE